MISLSLTLAYVGPETVLPVASVLVAALGFLLAGWSWVVRGVKRAALFCLGRSASDGSPPTSEPADAAVTPDR
jgi:hypothetical protein